MSETQGSGRSACPLTGACLWGGSGGAGLAALLLSHFPLLLLFFFTAGCCAAPVPGMLLVSTGASSGNTRSASGMSGWVGSRVINTPLR